MEQHQIQVPLKINNEENPKWEFTIVGIKVEQEPSFIDYIQAGIEINLIAAIDFTGSNGDPHLPSSLHYFVPCKSD